MSSMYIEEYKYAENTYDGNYNTGTCSLFFEPYDFILFELKYLYIEGLNKKLKLLVLENALVKGNTYSTNENQSIRKYLQVFRPIFCQKREELAPPVSHYFRKLAVLFLITANLKLGLHI